MRRRLCVWMLILCVTCAQAKSHHGFRKSSMPTTVISPSHDSLLRQNQAIDQMGLVRLQNEDAVQAAISRGDLEALPITPSLHVASSLPLSRRYALKQTTVFLLSLSEAYRLQFGEALIVDSAVRSADTQRTLRRVNHAAAPVDGETASSHESGATFDLSKRMTYMQRRWLEARLSYEVAMNHAIVENEKACYHVMVIGGTE